MTLLRRKSSSIGINSREVSRVRARLISCTHVCIFTRTDAKADELGCRCYIGNASQNQTHILPEQIPDFKKTLGCTSISTLRAKRKDERTKGRKAAMLISSLHKRASAENCSRAAHGIKANERWSNCAGAAWRLAIAAEHPVEHVLSTVPAAHFA